MTTPRMANLSIGQKFIWNNELYTLVNASGDFYIGLSSWTGKTSQIYHSDEISLNTHSYYHQKLVGEKYDSLTFRDILIGEWFIVQGNLFRKVLESEADLIGKLRNIRVVLNDRVQCYRCVDVTLTGKY